MEGWAAFSMQPRTLIVDLGSITEGSLNKADGDPSLAAESEEEER